MLCDQGEPQIGLSWSRELKSWVVHGTGLAHGNNRSRRYRTLGIRVENKERVVHITMDRPPLNVLDIPLLRELDAALTACAEDTATDVMVIEGAGQRAFSAGVDIRDHTRENVPEMLEVVHGVIRKLFMVPQVTIALVRGVCLGGGCELASSCDFVIASEDSSFATPEIHVGCYPPVALARFSSLIGYHRAAEMILTGRTFSAQEALSIGLINRVLPSDQLEAGLAVFIGRTAWQERGCFTYRGQGSTGTFSQGIFRCAQTIRGLVSR